MKTNESERIAKLVDVFDNFMCNVSMACRDRDWEMVKAAYDTAQWEREQDGFPRFHGGPNLEA